MVRCCFGDCYEDFVCVWCVVFVVCVVLVIGGFGFGGVVFCLVVEFVVLFGGYYFFGIVCVFVCVVDVVGVVVGWGICGCVIVGGGYVVLV